MEKKKSENMCEMYIKKEKPYEKVLVKIKALFEWLLIIETEVPKNGEIKVIRRVKRTASSETEAKTYESGPT